MDDLDAELARFQAEISSVEAQASAAEADAPAEETDGDAGGTKEAAQQAGGAKEAKRAKPATLSAKPVKRAPGEIRSAAAPPDSTSAADANKTAPAPAPALPPPVQPPPGALPPPAQPPYAGMPQNSWMPPAAPAPYDYGGYGGYPQDPYGNPGMPGGSQDAERQRLQAQALANVQAMLGKAGQTKPRDEKAHFRQAAGTKWVDPTLSEWPDDDYRIFVGDLGKEVNDELLSKAFQKYPSFNKAKIVRDKRSGKSKGFGFVSFSDVEEYAKVLREMNGKYIGNRPCKLSKSTWDERSDSHAAKKKRKPGQTAAIGPAKHARKHLPMIPK
mmetsp:Transcript_10164/g.25875  ORF Transcript_10164/g.25875 Transcript_10164/m.25875 type:complete len:329 (+) Transcript_10164:181-1167(+)